MTPQPEHIKAPHSSLGGLAPEDAASVNAAIGAARFGAQGMKVAIGPDAEHPASGVNDAYLFISGTPLSRGLPTGHGKLDLARLIVEAVEAARSSQQNFNGSVAVGPDSHTVHGKGPTGGEPSVEISIGT